MSTICHCARCQSYRRMHWRPRVECELSASAARGFGSFEFELSVRPADVPQDRPADGAPPEEADRFAARQLQLWLGRCRQVHGGALLRFHATIARGLGDRRDVVALVHGPALRAPAMLSAWLGEGAFRPVAGDGLEGLRVLRRANACEVVKTRASLHYGQPEVAAARRENPPRRLSVKARGTFATRGPRRVLFGPSGPTGAVAPGPRARRRSPA